MGKFFEVTRQKTVRDPSATRQEHRQADGADAKVLEFAPAARTGETEAGDPKSEGRGTEGRRRRPKPDGLARAVAAGVKQ